MRPRPQRLLDYREFPVLYVDDEPENLRMFQLGFRREFTVHTAEGAEQGLRILAEQPIAIVLSDHLMPGMRGVDFLARAQELDPKTVRMLVTAYGDAATLGSAINDGSIYRYIAKPWAPEEMRLALRHAIEFYALDREREELLDELTTLNQVAKTINQELELDALVALLLGTLTRDLAYDAATLFFFDAQEERLLPVRTVIGGAASEPALPAPVIAKADAEGFLRRLRLGEAQLLPVERLLQFERGVRRWLTEIAADEALVLPLVGKQGVIGALALDNRRGGARFEVSDRTLLEGFTTQAAIAIENARLVQDLRESREQVMRADRLGHLGTLAAGLAHEINNPLVAIHTFLSLAPAKRAQGDPEFWESYHALACREVERIRTLVTTMGRLARGGGGAGGRESCDVGELARDVAVLLTGEASAAKVALRLECEASAPRLEAVRDQIQQLLLNLVLNAVQATPAGGEVVVRVAADARRQGTGLVIDVADTGCGIPAEGLERIFDPFYTTKGPDRGMGLGLMICDRIVADHGGVIEVRSRPGEGATFRVRLPAQPAEGRAEVPAAPCSRPEGPAVLDPPGREC